MGEAYGERTKRPGFAQHGVWANLVLFFGRAERDNSLSEHMVYDIHGPWFRVDSFILIPSSSFFSSSTSIQLTI